MINENNWPEDGTLSKLELRLVGRIGVALGLLSPAVQVDIRQPCPQLGFTGPSVNFKVFSVEHGHASIGVGKNPFTHLWSADGVAGSHDFVDIMTATYFSFLLLIHKLDQPFWFRDGDCVRKSPDEIRRKVTEEGRIHAGLKALALDFLEDYLLTHIREHEKLATTEEVLAEIANGKETSND